MHSTETGRCGNVQYGGQSARIREIEGRACHSAERVIAVSGVLKEEAVKQKGGSRAVAFRIEKNVGILSC